MKVTSLRSKLDRILKKSHFRKSTSSKSRIKGLQNVTAGYFFRKYFDEVYLMWTFGNILHRGTPQEEYDKKTQEMYDYLCEQGLSEHIEMSDWAGKKAILLKGEE